MQQSNALDRDVICPACYRRIKPETVTDYKEFPDRYSRRRSYVGSCGACRQTFQVIQYAATIRREHPDPAAQRRITKVRWFLERVRYFERLTFETGHDGYIWAGWQDIPRRDKAGGIPPVLLGPGGDYDKPIDLFPALMQDCAERNAPTPALTDESAGQATPTTKPEAHADLPLLLHHFGIALGQMAQVVENIARAIKEGHCKP